MGIWDWIDPKNISSKIDLEKILKIVTRLLYFLTLASAAIRTFIIPRDYYKIFFDFVTNNTDSWGNSLGITLWISIFIAFLLFIIFRLYLRYKNLVL